MGEHESLTLFIEGSGRSADTRVFVRNEAGELVGQLAGVGEVAIRAEAGLPFPRAELVVANVDYNLQKGLVRGA